jgi:hypothetical protein
MLPVHVSDMPAAMRQVCTCEARQLGTAAAAAREGGTLDRWGFQSLVSTTSGPEHKQKTLLTVDNSLEALRRAASTHGSSPNSTAAAAASFLRFIGCRSLLAVGGPTGRNLAMGSCS